MNELNKQIEKLKQADDTAFAYIYNEFEVPLINHLFRMLGHQERAEEAFQDVMLIMIQKIHFYEDRSDLKSPFKSWLFRIATNKAIDELRKKKKMAYEVEELIETDIAEVIIEENLKYRLSELIMTLPLIQRTFLNLRVKEDLSYFEIARICGCNVNSVKQGLFRARKSLKDLIVKEGLEI